MNGANEIKVFLPKPSINTICHDNGSAFSIQTRNEVFVSYLLTHSCGQFHRVSVTFVTFDLQMVIIHRSESELHRPL